LLTAKLGIFRVLAADAEGYAFADGSDVLHHMRGDRCWPAK